MTRISLVTNTMNTQTQQCVHNRHDKNKTLISKSLLTICKSLANDCASFSCMVVQDSESHDLTVLHVTINLLFDGVQIFLPA